jgi:hypothetical protein
MSRHGSRRSERVQSDKPAAAATAVSAARTPEPAATPAPTPAAGPQRLHWTWKLTTLLWAGAFVALMLYEWAGTVYRMFQ